MKQVRPKALINLDNYEKNIRNIQNHVKPHVLIMAVVKADAYGHQLKSKQVMSMSLFQT